MQYLSEDEESETNEEMTLDEMYPEEELDEEMQRLILKSASIKNNDDLDAFQSSSKKSPKKSTPTNKTSKDSPISLKAFTEKVDAEEQSNKWINKRIKSKTNLDKVTKIRQFSPRLPPYKLVNREVKEIKIIKDDTSFPSLNSK